MKILVTGANGLLGQELIKQLINQGKHEVIASSRGESRLPLSLKVKYYDLDITYAASVFKVIEEVQPQLLIHAAAMTQVDDCEENKQHCYNTNVGASRFLIDACKPFDTRFIYISTDFVFDGLSGPYSEESQPAPVNYYGSTKLAAENAVRESGLSWTIIRTVLVYGNSTDASRTNLITWVKKNLESGNPIKVVSDQWRTATYVEDLATGILLAVEKNAEGVFHISGKDMLTPFEMAIKTADMLGLDRSLIEKVDASSFKQCGERPKKTGFVIDKARSTLGYEPVTFMEGLKKMFQNTIQIPGEKKAAEAPDLR